MSKFGFIFLLANFAFCWTLSRREFDWKAANTSIWLSSGAYCPTSTYLSRQYLGYSEGFVATSAIADLRSDTQGFIGYHPEHQNIYVVLRGTTSLQNWMNDFDAVMVKYNASAECTECYVHKGFAYAWNQVALKVVEDVKALREKFPDFHIIVTGHSLGGALASLAAIQLQQVFSAEAAVTNTFSLRAVQKLGAVPKVRLFTFGAPRFSNQALSDYASKLLDDKHRITHYRDIAPHVPPFWQYIHIQGEWYEDELGAVHTCTGFEDPDCADRWYYTSVEDHMHYLGLPVGCLSVSGGTFLSTIITDPSPQAHPDKSENIIPGEALTYQAGGKPSDRIP